MLNLIGNTPLQQLRRIGKTKDSAIFAKLEMYNPTASIKDRIVHYMIEAAEKSGQIKPGATIVDASSGNTAASIAMVAKQKGYKAVITTTEKTSQEKLNIIRLLGAKVHVCSTKATADSDEHYINKAKHFAREIPGAFMLDQYNRDTNIKAHYATTGPEIWEQMDGKIDYLVACASSGGTITGIATYLKEQDNNVKIILADPIGSIYYSYFHKGIIDKNDVKPYAIEGVGKDFICQCFHIDLLHDAVRFSDDEAYTMLKRLASEESILAGGSSGAAVFVAESLIKSGKIQGRVVVILPDSGLKYLSKIPTNENE